MSLDIKEEVEDFIFVDVDESAVQDQLFKIEDERESSEIIEVDPLALNHEQYEIIEPPCVFRHLKLKAEVSELVKCEPEIYDAFPSPKSDSYEGLYTARANILQSASENKAIENEIVVVEEEWEGKEENQNIPLCVCFSCKNQFRCISSLEKHCECKGSCKNVAVSKLSCPCGTLYNNHKAYVVPSEPMFQCKHCDLLFSQATELIAHSKSHERKHNSCANCNKIFCSFDKLEKHLSSCEGENSKENRRRPTRTKHGSGNCSTCQIVSSSVKRRRHSKCAKKQSPAQSCVSKNTSRKKTLKKKKEVLKDKPSKDVFVACSSCKIVFPSSKHVKDHCSCNGRRLNCKCCTENPEVIKESHVCNTCEVTFTSVEAMRSHCSCSGQDICIECFSTEDDDTFSMVNEDCPDKSSKLLDAHPRNHLKECKICGDFFIDHNTLLIHEKQHVKLKCFKCQRRFNSVKVLRRHLGICHSKIESSNGFVTYDANIPRSKDYRCGECGMETNFRDSLVRHMMVHSKIYPFECRVCHKGFKHRWSMIRHEFLHSGVKPFICPICHASFADLGNCKAHQKVHLGIKRSYKCPNCHIIFRSRVSCMKHKQQYHS